MLSIHPNWAEAVLKNQKQVETLADRETIKKGMNTNAHHTFQV